MNKRIIGAVIGFLGLGLCAFGQDVIVEASSEGQNNQNYREIRGKWIDGRTPANRSKSTAPGSSPQTVGSRKVLFNIMGTNTMTTEPTAARFTPNLQSPAKLSVYVTWPSASNAMPVYYTVKHSGGEEKKTLSQDGWGGVVRGGNGNQWNPLGTFEFGPGPDQYVEISTDVNARAVYDAANSQVYADAVRFTAAPLGANQLKGVDTAAAAAAQASTQPTPSAAVSAQPIVWLFDIQSAQAAAKAQNKRILLFFHAPGSPASSKMEETLNAAAVRGIINTAYVPVKMDFAQNTQMAYQLQIFRAATLALYESDGSPIMHITDRLTETELAERLKRF